MFSQAPSSNRLKSQFQSGPPEYLLNLKKELLALQQENKHLQSTINEQTAVIREEKLKTKHIEELMLNSQRKTAEDQRKLM